MRLWRWRQNSETSLAKLGLIIKLCRGFSLHSKTNILMKKLSSLFTRYWFLSSALFCFFLFSLKLSMFSVFSITNFTYRSLPRPQVKRSQSGESFVWNFSHFSVWNYKSKHKIHALFFHLHAETIIKIPVELLYTGPGERYWKIISAR